MKSINIFKIIGGALLLIIIVILFWGNKRITKLQADFNSSQGKNIVYEQQAQVLKDSIARINTSYAFLQKNNDSLVKMYKEKVGERDAIIARYKKDHQIINSLSDIKSIEYFNLEIASTSPVVITSVIPDTTFSIPVGDIKKANDKFVENHQFNETNSNLKESELSLLRINTGLRLEINNRQSAINKLTELVINKDNQINEGKTQIKDLEKINKKKHRADNIGKVIIGGIGIGVGIIVGLIL